MRFKERNFPHPVLDPTGNDITGSAFQASYTVSSDSTFVYISVSFTLNNPTLAELIAAEKAKFVVHADCNAAFFRKTYLFNEETGRVQIPITDVKRVVELAFFICATQPLPDYTIQGMDALYEGTVFKIQAGDILAYSDQASITILDKDSLSKIASIMLVREGDAALTVPVINYESDKIEVSLPVSQFALYAPMKADQRVKAAMLSVVVLPVLVDAVHEVLNVTDN